MVLDFGYIQKYNSQRGFGFVECTFNNQQPHKSIFFHIKQIKKKYPELAQQLDNEIFQDVCFWYESEKTNKGEQIFTLWVNANDIPEEHKKHFVSQIEKLWVNSKYNIPQWLESITTELLGVERTKNLKQEQLHREQKADTRENREIKQIYTGLPKHLANHVFWPSRSYRTNHLSHIRGGSDVVVEYHEGDVFGYDWIKVPSAYIWTIFCEQITNEYYNFEYLNEKEQIHITKEKIARIFTRKSKNKDDSSTLPFKEIWNSETSQELPWKTLEKIEINKQNKHNFKQDDYDYDSISHRTYEYDAGYEDPTDIAENIYGIPDPRLVEDW